MSKPSDHDSRMEALKRSPAYIKAYEDVDFLHRYEMRPIRLELELLKPQTLLSEQKVHSTIVCWGSARLCSPEDAKAKLARVEADLAKKPKDKTLLKIQAQAKRIVHNAKFYNEARKFGEIVTKRCQPEGKLEF